MRDDKQEVRCKLINNCLSQQWLIEQLKRLGVHTSTTELSNVLRGIRGGEKATTIISKSLYILNDYERKFS